MATNPMMLDLVTERAEEAEAQVKNDLVRIQRDVERLLRNIEIGRRVHTSEIADIAAQARRAEVASITAATMRETLSDLTHTPGK